MTRTAGKEDDNPWQFGNISRRRAEYVLTRQLARLDEAVRASGMFLVRDKDKSQTFVLSIVLENKFWHHLLKQTSSGMWYLNNTLLPVRDTLAGVVAFLGDVQPSLEWSTPLVNAASRKTAEQRKQLGPVATSAEI